MAIANSPITVPISLGLLVDDIQSPTLAFSTARSEADGLVTIILQGIRDIWDQANIDLQLGSVSPIEVPWAVLEGFARSTSIPEVESFMDDVEALHNPDAGGVTAYFLRRMCPGLNGIARPRSNTLYVIDEPRLEDPTFPTTSLVHNGRRLGVRVASHEVGHIFGLPHYREPQSYDRDRLMFSGTTGTTLAPGEIITARVGAQALLNGP